MEFPFRSATASTLVYATEDEQCVLTVIRTLLPEGVEIHRSKLKGHHGNPIVVLEARVGQREVRKFWQGLVAKMHAGELEKLGEIAPGRVDEDCCFYLRFDKQLAHSGELVLTESGDAIHLKLKVAAYPARREVAVGLVKRLVEELAKSRS